MSLRQPHRAIVDPDGNIILPGDASAAMQPSPAPRIEVRMEAPVFEMAMEEPADDESYEEVMLAEEEQVLSSVPMPEAGRMSRTHGLWETREEPAEPQPAPGAEQEEEIVDWTTMLLQAEVMSPTPSTLERLEAEDRGPNAASQAWDSLRQRLYEVTTLAATETAKQYGATLIDGKQLGERTVGGLRGALHKTRRFLTQPVWVPARKNQAKQYKRGTLFVMDMARFGGTFAVLFLGLFFALNYESFWDIAKAHVDPLADLRAAVTDAAGDTNDLGAQFKPTALSLTARTDGDLLSFVPPVGPPENMIVIPKLGLQAPIQDPQSDALLKEDWSRLEEEIQAALANGVVHYPGTARPGQAGNFFVTGHSSYFPWAPGEYKSVFARLHALQPGDEYWVFYGGDKYRYIIQDTKEVKPSDVSVLDQPVQKRISTLMTCSPVGTTLRRLIITAQEVDPTTGLALEVGEHAKREAEDATRPEMLPI